LRNNRNDLEYTATLETRLATLTNDYELKLSHKETKIQNLQHRLIDVEKAKNLLIEEMDAQRRSATLEDGATFEQQTTEIQELQHMVHDLIEHTPIDETGTPYLFEGALTEAQAAHQRALQEKDVEIAQLLEYIAGVENLNAIAAKRDTKLREVETRLDELQTSHQRLASEKAAQEAELADKDAQLTELLERVSFIGTLRKQYAEKETELQAIEEKFQTAINHKNLEIHFLQERVDNLEKLHTTSIEDLKTGHASELAEKDFAIRELQSQTSGVNETSSLAASPGKLDLVAQYQSALEAKDEEIADLQERIQALETLFAAHSEEVDLKLKEKEAEILKSREDAEALEVFVAAHSQEIDARLKEKEAEILELQECITDLESANFISQELKKMAAQYQATIQTKNSEIVRLQMRINQLEPFSALVAQRDARIRELDSRYQIAIGAKDAEITRLQNRLKELNSTAKMAY
jgi:DNA repair exonuclease SbcCD ATPase subunit